MEPSNAEHFDIALDRDHVLALLEQEDLENEIYELRLKLERAAREREERLEMLERVLRERDEYQSQLHEKAELIAQMTSAASGAAATAVTTIERLQQMDVVVKAAQDWYQDGDDRSLSRAVAAYTKIERSRS